jgi:hypothetical protein
MPLLKSSRLDFSNGLGEMRSAIKLLRARAIALIDPDIFLGQSLFMDIPLLPKIQSFQLQSG